MTTSVSSGASGSGFLTVLGAAFAVAGLWASWQALHLLESGGPVNAKLAIAALIGVLF